MKLTNAQWNAIRHHIPAEEFEAPGGKGGRPWADPRSVLNGVLWILRTGARWCDLPERFPAYQTCHRRFSRWAELEVMPKILAGLRKDLYERGGIEDVEGFMDGTYVPAKKGAQKTANAAQERQPRSWRSRTAMVFRSLSILDPEIDTIVLSPKELLMLRSWHTYLPESLPIKRGIVSHCAPVYLRNATLT